MHSNKTAGLTFIEVMIALVIISLSVAVLAYVTSTISDMRLSQNRSVAVNFARSYTDTVKALWTNNRGGTSNFSDTPFTLPAFAPPATFFYQVDVFRADNNTLIATCGAPLNGVSSCGSIPGAVTSGLGCPQRILTVTVTSSVGPATARTISLSTRLTRADLPAITPSSTTVPACA